MLNVKDNRETYRDMGGGKNLDSPFNEGFSFTQAEYDMLKQERPSLFDDDPQRRHNAWVQWSQTSEGKAFRVR